MATEQTARLCSSCREQRLHIRQGVNHLLHLLLTLVTGGLWIVGWLIALGLKPGWRCSQCGTMN